MMNSMRLRASLIPPALVTLTLVLPLVAHATGVPFFGPLIPSDAQQCAAGLGQLAAVVNNAISFLLTMLILIVAPFVIVWAGLLFVVSPGNPGNVSKARGILLNLVIGITISLAAWLIIDLLLTMLTTQGVQSWTQNLFSTSGGCLVNPGTQFTSSPTQSGGGTQGAGVTAQSYNSTGTYGVSGTQCASDNPACSVSALEAVGYTQAQANAMSCIAVTESSGNPNTPNNSRSGACGTFQLVPGNWSSLSQIISGCGGASCNSASCNLQATYALSRQNVAAGKSVYQPWTCPGCNANAAGCVAQYDPSS